MIHNSLNIHGVKRTALEALSCKVSALPTQFAELTLPQLKKKSPLLNRIYAFRSLVVHKIVDICLDLEHSSGVVCQLLALGGGLDTSYDKICNSRRQLFVVDLPEVIDQRRVFYDSVVGESDGVGGRPIMISADMNMMDHLMESITTAGFNKNKPAIVLIECVLSYLSKTSHHNVLATLSSHLHPDSILITYDPHVDSGSNHKESEIHKFSAEMREKFKDRTADLAGTHTNLMDHMLSLHSCNWRHNVGLTINQAWRLLFSANYREKILQQLQLNEPFDEISSLVLLNSLYAVSISSSSRNKFDCLWNALCENAPNQDLVLRATIASNRCRALEIHSRSLQLQSNVLETWVGRGSFKFIIRRANSNDSNTLQDLYINSFRRYCQDHRSVAKYVSRAAKELSNIDRFYPADSIARLIVAEIKGQGNLIGCIGLKVRSKRATSPVETNQVIEISHYCVDPLYRTNGVGRQLLSSIILYAKSLSQQRIQLTVLEDLIEARRLYEREGFRIVNISDIGNNCILNHMELTL